MDIAQVATFMKAHSTHDSYHFQEEIELRKILGRTRDDSLEGFFLSLFYSLQGDVRARTRLVDIALRYGNHATLACAAASKIGSLTDEDKILLIPAHLFSSAPEVALAIAKQIGSIRADDPRRYFLERGLGHPDPSVRRVCAESLAYRPNTQVHEYVHASAALRHAAEPESTLKDKNVPVKRKMKEGTKRIEMEFVPKAPADGASIIQKPSDRIAISLAPTAGKTRDSTRGAVRHVGENLLELIAAHIGDPRSEVRLKWVRRIGEIPAQDDADDVRKIEFITIALADSSREVSLASVAQIEFLLLDESKLAMLLKILALSPDLVQAVQFQKALDSLPSALREEYISFTNKIVSDRGKGKRADASTSVLSDSASRKKGEVGDARAGDRRNAADSPNSGKSATGRDGGGKAAILHEGISSRAGKLDIGEVKKSADARDRGDESMKSVTVSDADRAEIQVILSELNFDERAIADLTNEKSSTGAFFNAIAPIPEAQKIDNYFLRHTAVLHVKDLHAEDIRYRLYLSVLDYDPKDIVRQIAVQEARNLESGHAQEILRRALADNAWQVRVSALENLLHFIPDADEKRRILTTCSRDAEYHVRQKTTTLLAALADGEREKIQLL